DWLFFLQGFAVDGVFALSITIVLARTMPIDLAVVTGGTLLAMRHVGEAVAAPMFGKLADQFGAARLFLLSMLITAAGFALVAASYTITGALTMLVFRGSLAATGPATIVQDAGPSNPVMGDLANMQAWRDLGAAVGPLGTGVLLGSVAANNVGTLAQDAHGILAVVLVAASLWWWLRRRQRL
ncbi:MAG: hypothetical protein HOI95_02855, partial [Chromatiales bacterium]|nr:hypothetical protein [Chromatiales bacterium]